MPMVFFGLLRNLSEEKLVELGAILGIDLTVPDFPDPDVPDVPPTPSPPTPSPGQPPEPPPGSVGPTFDRAPQAVREVIVLEWPPETWERAAAISECESEWDPTAHNEDGEDSRGYWQINVVPAANIDLLALGDLFDPRINARAGAIVWERQGWVAWLNCATRLGIPRSGPGVP